MGDIKFTDLEQLPHFKKININVGGTIIDARPVAWNAEAVDGEGHTTDGGFILATEYETACPHCGQLLRFAAGLESAKCTNCERGEDVKIIDDFPDPFHDPGEYIAPDAWLEKNPKALKAVKEGIEDARAGRTSKLTIEELINEPE